MVEWHGSRLKHEYTLTGYCIVLRSSWDVIAASELHSLLGLRFLGEDKNSLVPAKLVRPVEAVKEYLRARNDRINARACQHRKFGDQVSAPKPWMISVLVAPGGEDVPDLWPRDSSS